MADTYTTNLNLTKPEPGAAEDTWGISLNADLDSLDAIFSSSGTQINLNPNQINFADGKKLILGTGSDLSIYHSGTNSHIADTGEGNLYLDATNLIVRNGTGTETYMTAANNGGVVLYHDNTGRVSTTSSGLDVTGTVTSDGLTVDTNTGSFNDNAKLEGLVGDIRFNYTQFGGSGNYGGSLDFYTKESSTVKRLRQRIANNGDISFYDDTGSTQGLFWDASAERLGIGTTSPTSRLTIASGSNSTNTGDGIHFFGTSSNNQAAIQSFNTGAYYGDLRFYTSNHATASTSIGDERLRIARNGDISFYEDTGTSQALFWDASAESLGIGTTTPNYLLDVEGSGSLLRVNSTSGDSNIDLRVADTTSLNIINFGDSGSSNAGRILYRHSGDSMAFNVAGSEAVRIINGGNVGIGTDSPSADLSIGKNGNATGGNIQLGVDTNNTNKYCSITTKAYASDAQTKGFVNVASQAYAGNNHTFIGGGLAELDASNQIRFYTASGVNITGGSERARFDSSGNFGIATTNPSQRLSVADGMHVTPASAFSADTSGTYTLAVGANSGGKSAIFDQTIVVEGSVGIGTTSPSGELHVKSASTNANFYLQRSIYDPWLLSAGSTYLTFSQNSGELMRIDSSGNVGIGTDAPSAKLDVLGDDTSGASITWKQGTRHSGYLYSDTSGVAIYDTNLNNAGIYLASNNKMDFRVNGSERMRITSSGNVGIGVVPSYPLHVGTSGAGIKGFFSNTTDADLTFNLSSGVSLVTPTTGILAFGTASTERMRIDSSGNLLVGTTSQYGSTGITLQQDGLVYARRTGVPSYLRRDGSDGDIIYMEKDGTKVGSIGTAGGDLLIGTGNTGLLFYDASPQIIPRNTTGANVDATVDLGSSGSRFKDLHLSGVANVGDGIQSTSTTTGFGYLNFGDTDDANVGQIGYDHTSNYMRFQVNNTEKARIDSGNLLVGKTSDDGTAGVRIGGSGTIVPIASGIPIIADRLSSDGEIIRFRKDGSTVGSIETATNTNTDISVGSDDIRLLFFTNGSAIIPRAANNGGADDTIDLGGGSNRFQDIYATNATIQTSDINEKQDIEDLSEAETRVAVAAKGLLKKYRWKSAVADKGDDARIHFGIMAQDLQQAFSAEGLDAGDYGMFISSTWTDETTGEEKTRLGVRYNELLAFIIAAI